VIGVEAMPGPQRPGGDCHSQPDAQARVAEVVRRDREGEDPPSAGVQRGDHGCHRAQPAPLGGGQGAGGRAQAGSRVLHRLIPLMGRRMNRGSSGATGPCTNRPSSEDWSRWHGGPGDRTHPRLGVLPLRDSAGISPDFAVLPATPAQGPGQGLTY
jgi:hypothetical protein